MIGLPRRVERAEPDRAQRPDTAAAGAAAIRVGRVGRFVVTSGDRDVTRYLLDHLLIPHGRRARVRRAALPWLPRGLRERWLFQQRGALDLTGAGGEASDTVAGLLRTAALVVNGTPLEGWRPARWIALVDPASSGRRRATMFLFRPRGETPAAVLKVRGPEAAGSPLQAEADALHRVRSRGGDLAGSVPEPLAHRRWSGGEALLLRALPGASAYALMRARTGGSDLMPRHFEQAGVWLARFHGRSRAPAPTHAGLTAGEREAATAALAALVELAGLQSAAARDAEAALAAASPPRAAAHGDFWPHNVLPAPGAALPGVVDWEHYAEDAPRILDLFDFPFSYGLEYSWRRGCVERPARAFEKAFLEDTRVACGVRLYFDRYCVATGLDTAELRPLLHVYLLLKAGAARPGTGSASRRPQDFARFHESLAGSMRPRFLP